MIDAVIVEVPNTAHPSWVRGVGETPIVPVIMAISNAIHKAVGARLNRLPMAPDRAPEALWRQKRDGATGG